MILCAAYTSIDSEDAVRAGFKKAWQEHDHAVIVAVADKISSNVLDEDPKLRMWFDKAVTRMEGE